MRSIFYSALSFGIKLFVPGGFRHISGQRFFAGVFAKKRLAFLVILSLGLFPPARLSGKTTKPIRIAFLSQTDELTPNLSNLTLPPNNLGISGGMLGISDNNTTGVFLKQSFSWEAVVLKHNADPVSIFKKLAQKKIRHIVLNVRAGDLLKMADLPMAKNILIYNVGAKDNALRTKECRPNVMHLVPSRAMLADALAQFLTIKNWQKWFLVVGKTDADKKFAMSVRRAAKRFGAKIIREKIWDFGPDTRRTAQAEVPVFTQGVDYDVLITADEIGLFGEYVMYRTWRPMVVAGTQGLVPISWHWTHERWGAAQLQSRFLKQFHRRMEELDYSTWQAVRAIGEAAARTAPTNFGKIRKFFFNDEFALAGFKGQKLTFRKWNQQLRQPILLASPTSMVSVAPQQRFLHQRTVLDTLGYDKPNSKCRFNPK